jgi:hypothetical protein
MTISRRTLLVEGLGAASVSFLGKSPMGHPGMSPSRGEVLDEITRSPAAG